MDLRDIAAEPDPELRARLLGRWASPYCTSVWVWNGTAELWFSMPTLDPQKPMDPWLYEQFNAVTKATLLQVLLGASGPVSTVWEEVSDLQADIF